MVTPVMAQGRPVTERGRRMAALVGHDARMTPQRDRDSLERADLVASLDKHRGFLRQTLRNVSDEDAARRTTVSELCLGGIVKHVTLTEDRWAEFIEQGADA